MRVLVVEDEAALAESVGNKLTAAGMRPSFVANGLHAQEMLVRATQFQRPYDVVLLDLSLPGMDGIDVLTGMRRRKDMTPVLILTARGTIAERIGGLDAGADDYLSKPCDADELIARLRVISRRNTNAPSLLPSVGNLSYDSIQGKFLVDGCELTLSPALRSALHALFRRRGSPVPKDYLMNLDEEGASAEAVDTTMFRLRRRLREAGASVTIKTLKLTGFMLEADGAA